MPTTMLSTVQAVGDAFAGQAPGRRALIAGAGIGGLAAGIGLARAGWKVVVAERAAEPREVGAGIALWANGLAALSWLGLGSEARELARPECTAGFRTADGSFLFATGSEQLQARWGTLVVVLHREELHALLLRAFRRAGGRVQCGAGIESFVQDDDGVTARLAGGVSLRADLLVGADGVGSAVRARLHGDEPPRYAGYTAWRGVVSFDTCRLTPGESWGRGARFGMAPLADGRTYWFATKDAPAGGRSPDGEKAELLRTFGSWHDPIADLITATPEAAILRHDITDRDPLRRWGMGRVTLLGDAAHPMTPNLGQGACQALEDAVALARSLGVPGRAPVARALQRYEAERLPRANAFVRRSRSVGTVGQWSNPLAVRVRTAAARSLMSRLQPRTVAEIMAHGIPEEAPRG